jgi:hypothetical protein
MIAQKREFYGGLGLFMGFLVVLVIIFLPIFKGLNVLEYLDSLYNSISKGSAYHIPKVREEASKFKGNTVSVMLTMANKKQVEQIAALFRAAAAEAAVTDSGLQVSGDLGEILESCLTDADAMYGNDGEKVAKKYGYDEKRVLFNWWQACKAMDKKLKKRKKFKEAQVVVLVQKKALETSYNYYKIEPQKIGDRLGVVIFSLFFYVVYTLWYGFAVMFMFEGWGLRLTH